MSRVSPKSNSFDLGMFLHSDVDDAGLDVYEFRIWGRLCRRAGDNGRVFESAKKMAQGCQMSEKRVRQALHSLRERGWLELVPRYRDDGSQTTNDVILLGPRHQIPAPLVGDTSPPGITYRPEGNPSEGNPTKVLKTLVISPDGEARVSPNHATAEGGQEPPSHALTDSVETAGKGSRQDKATSSEKVPGGAAALLALWNEHCGPLPKAEVMTKARETALNGLSKAFGDAASSLLADAVREVALDAFWKERRYGLDNLLRGKVPAKAEAWRARKPSGLSRRRNYD